MSTVKSKKLQVGTDATSSNNFTIYQPSTPDGSLRIGVGNANSPTEVAQVTSNGLSVTGRIQTSAQPAFGVYATVSQNNGNVSNGTHVIDWGGVSVDTTSSFDLTNNRYVIPVTGTYFFTTTISWQTSSISGRYVRSAIRNNGNTFAGNHTHISNESGDDDYMSGTVSYVANFTAGDYVDVTWGTVTTSEVRIMTGSRSTIFAGYLIG